MTRLVLATIITALLAVTAVLASHGHRYVTQVAPRACVVAGNTLPSGDAIAVDARGNAWGVEDRTGPRVRELVCTDGTWVHVTGYGN